MEPSSRDRTIEAAARWYARQLASDCTQQEREEFARWLELDPTHAAAYAAAQRFADRVSLAAVDSRLKAMADQAFAAGAAGYAAAPDDPDDREAAAAEARSRPASARRRPSRRWAIAAGLAAGAIATLLAVGLPEGPRPPDPAEPVTLVATSDGTRELALSDGTTVHVDVRSELEIRFTSAQRQVALTRGRAIFDVAPESARPFTVSAGAGRVTAVGTRFQVERTSERLIVTLAEGSVIVDGASGDEAWTQRLVPGEQLSILASSPQWLKRSVDSRAATSWSVGRLVFRDVRLADAVSEINRYAAVRVRLADPTLDDLSVSGNFVAGDSDAVVAAFAVVLPLRVTKEGDELLLFRREQAQRD
jgi:transmembrane sensor